MPTRSRSVTTTEAAEVRMSITNTGEMTRRPTHPGEMLREDFVRDYGLTVASLAEALESRARPSMNCCASGAP